MARYQYEKSEVDQSLSLLQEAVKIINQSEAPIQSGLDGLTATGIDDYLQDYGTIRDNLYNIATTSAEYVNKLYSTIDSKAKEIEEYNGKSTWSKVLATTGLFTLKFVEGVETVLEGIIDGAVTLVGWVCNLLGGGVAGLFNGIGNVVSGKGTFKEGWDAGWGGVSNAINNSIGEFVKKDRVGDFYASSYAEGGWLNGLEKASAFSSQSTAANVFKGAGTIAGYIIIGAVTGGAGAHAALANGLVTGVATTGQATQRNLQNQGDKMNFFSASTEGVVEGAITGALAYGATKAKAARASKAKPKPEIEGQMDMFSEMDKGSSSGGGVLDKISKKTGIGSHARHAEESTASKIISNIKKTTGIGNPGKHAAESTSILSNIKNSAAVTSIKNATGATLGTVKAATIGSASTGLSFIARTGETIANTQASANTVRAKEEFDTFDLKGTIPEAKENFKAKSNFDTEQLNDMYAKAKEKQDISTPEDPGKSGKKLDNIDSNKDYDGNDDGGGNNGESNEQFRKVYDPSDSTSSQNNNDVDTTPTQSVTQVEKPSTETTPKQNVTQVEKPSNNTTPSTKTNPTPKTETPAPADKPSFNDDNLKQTSQTQSYDPGTIGGGSSSYNNGGYTYSGGESSYGDYSTEDPIDVASVTTEAGDENIMGDSSVGLGNLASSITNTQSYKNQTIKIPTTTGTVDEGSTNVAIPTAAALSAAAAAGIGAKAYVDYKENHKESEDEEESYEDGEENNGFYTEEWNGSEDDMKIDYGNEEEATLDDDEDYKYSANSIIEKYEEGNNLDLEEA